VLGNSCKHAGKLAEQLYDLPLCLPLWIESRIQQRQHNRNENSPEYQRAL
jgi:hypothetical protein